MPLKSVFAENVRRLMDARADLDSPSKIAARARWPAGSNKANRPVSVRAIQYALDTSAGSPSPSLDVVAAIAGAFKVEPWELLLDSAEARRSLLDRLMRGDSSRPGNGPPNNGH